uniref:Uncharacterized protein n=1 Tax=Romanomermis culicivorax TaxID=13658 RepID=A0A915IG22_ROMCU
MTENVVDVVATFYVAFLETWNDQFFIIICVNDMKTLLVVHHSLFSEEKRGSRDSSNQEYTFQLSRKKETRFYGENLNLLLTIELTMSFISLPLDKSIGNFAISRFRVVEIEIIIYSGQRGGYIGRRAAI